MGNSWANAEPIKNIQGPIIVPLVSSNTNAIDVATAFPANALPPPAKGNMFSFSCLNPNSAQVFIRFYDARAADINTIIGASGTLPNPINEFVVPGTGGTAGVAAGQVLIRGLELPWHYDVGLCVRCCVNFALSDTTAPGAAPRLYVDISSLLNQMPRTA